MKNKNIQKQIPQSFLPQLKEVSRQLRSSGIDIQTFVEFYTKEELFIPVGVLNQNIPPLSAIVQYLKHIKRFSNTEIANQLGRSSKTIWQALQQNRHLKPVPSQPSFPITILKKEQLSILESVIQYFSRTHTNKEIAQMFNKDPRIIATIKTRVKKKT